jgi:predicted TIM-barrel fold metal-dependent hydrolase
MRAIDVHAHPGTAGWYNALSKYNEAIAKHYGAKVVVKTDEEMTQDYRDLDVKVMMIAWDAEAKTGLPTIPNDYIAGLTERWPDVYLPGWAMVDPWKGEKAIQEIERAIKELGLVGVKFQQVAQEFFPNDRRFYPIWETCAALGVPVMFHTGTTGLAAGTPGAMGFHLKYTKPIPYIDDVAADFPKLKIIAAHPSWPWQDEMIAVVISKGNVFMELSGWAPRYFPEQLKREVNGRLQDRVMFGSDYPIIDVKRWLDEFENDGYKPAVIEKVFYQNAIRIFDLKL